MSHHDLHKVVSGVFPSCVYCKKGPIPVKFMPYNWNKKKEWITFRVRPWRYHNCWTYLLSFSWKHEQIFRSFRVCLQAWPSHLSWPQHIPTLLYFDFTALTVQLNCTSGRISAGPEKCPDTTDICPLLPSRGTLTPVRYKTWYLFQRLSIRMIL